MKSVKWNKIGALTFLGFAEHTERQELLLLFTDKRHGNQAVPFNVEDKFSQVGMPGNRRFDLIEQ